MNYATIATVVLTASTSILLATGKISSEESRQLNTTGAAVATSIGAFVAVIISIVRARKGKKSDGKE
jgi:Na+-driven multidrug efflux pump